MPRSLKPLCHKFLHFMFAIHLIYYFGLFSIQINNLTTFRKIASYTFYSSYMYLFHLHFKIFTSLFLNNRLIQKKMLNVVSLFKTHVTFSILFEYVLLSLLYKIFCMLGFAKYQTQKSPKNHLPRGKYISQYFKVVEMTLIIKNYLSFKNLTFLIQEKKLVSASD